MKGASKNKNILGNKLMIDRLIVRAESKEYKIHQCLKI